MHYDVIVLGAGINGLSTAYHLARRQAGRVAVLEQFQVAAGHGSSHGKSRITRSSYSTSKYVELVQVAHAEEWPRWSREAGRELLLATPGAFFGPGVASYWQALQAVPTVAPSVRLLSPEEGRREFPGFLFPDSPQVIKDSTCAVVAAEQTMDFLRETVGRECELVEGCRVTFIDRTGEFLKLQSNLGVYRCRRLVVTAGSWVGSLLPELDRRVQVAHQDVGYFEIEGQESLPVWVYIPEEGDSYYGLPSFGRPGAKIARHRTGPENDSPDREIAQEMPQSVLSDLKNFIAHQFGLPARLVGYEACLYTNTVSEDFLLDHHPEDSRIVIGSACSGHGFKFGPLTGRLLAELVMDGKSSLPLFEKHREAFRLAAHASWR